MTARKFSACMLVLLLTVSAFAIVSFGARADEGGADAYGYRWTDSNAPAPSVSYSWIDITGTGSDVGFYNADTLYAGPVGIGFPFEFYGNTYTALNISCNGYLQFDGSSSDQYNDPIPSSYTPNNLIAAFWDDLIVDDYPSYSGAVYYETIGTTPNQQFIVEFYEVTIDYSYDLLTFEIILNETGEIMFQYQSMNGETGAGATIGIENSNGLMGCPYSYGTDSVSDGLAILFEVGPMGFGADQTHNADWGTSSVYSLYVTNSQAFTDSFDITVDYSLLGWTVVLYDASYALLVDNNANAIPDTGDLAPGETFGIFAYVTVPDPPTDQNETTVLLASSFNDPLVNDTATLTTKAYQAHIGTTHTDWVYDSDSDGDNDSLNLSIEIDAVVGGEIVLGVNLYDGLSNYITYTYVYADVPAGSSLVNFSFSGEEIYTSMGDGPYNVEMSLYDADWMYVDYQAYVTSSYLYTDFDPPAVMFIPPFSDFAVDDDANTLYDYLVVNVTIEVFEPGSYRVEGEFYDDWNWDYLGSVNNGSSVGAGVYTRQLWLPSASIAESYLDGECYVYIYLYVDNYTWIDTYGYLTNSYLYSDFEGPSAAFEPPYEDYAVDTDSDFYYNYVNMTIYIVCGETGLYDLELWVYDLDGNVYDVIYETLSLTSGLTVSYTVTIDGGFIYGSGDWGYFGLEMLLYENASAVELDYDYYTTGYYYYWDFDPAGAYFDYVDEFGRDTDSDGYYNELVVVSYIEPLSSGAFMVVADVYVYDPYWGWTYYDFVEDPVTLVEGVTYEHEIVLDALGVIADDLYVYFYLDLYVTDASGMHEYDSTYYYTDYYYEDEFDSRYAEFVTPYEDYTRDDDFDDLYDVIVEVIYVVAPSMSGYYDVEVWVYDPYYYLVDSHSYQMYLEEGVVTAIEVEIPSSLVWNSGYDGYWYVEMDVYDLYTMDWFDADSDYTQYYYVDDFDPPPIVFDPPHDDYGFDTDSDTLYDYFVIEAELFCYEAGTYTVYADLYESWGGYVTSLESTESVTYGNEVFSFWFEGWILFYNGWSTDFYVDLTVTDDSGTTIDTDTHWTDYYAYSQFEPPPAGFSPPYEDYAIDEDGDSQYDYLVVNVSVEAFSPGTYIVTGVLEDEFWNYVDATSVQAELEEGVQVVQLYFDAWPIAAAFGDPMYVDLGLYDPYMNVMDEDGYYLTGTYNMTDFDPTVPLIESGWAYDVPTIDGMATASEWFGAAVVDLVAADSMNTVAATMYILNNGTHLFILIDATGDTTATEGDMAAVGFDTLNDGIWSDMHEDLFTIEALDTGTYMGHAVFDTLHWDWTMDCEPFDPLLDDHEGLAGAMGFGSSALSSTAHRLYEFCIPLDLLLAAPGDDIGFAGLPAVMDTDDGDYRYSTWPMFFWDYPELSYYGDLLLSQEPPLTNVSLSGDDGEAGWFVSEVEVTLDASGGTGGVNATYYCLDDGEWVEYTGPFTIDDDGAHTLQYYSDDVAGNEEPVRTVPVNIDTEAPETDASVDGTVGLDDWITADATVVFEVADDSSGLDYIMYRLDDGDWTELSGTSLEITEDGEHTLLFYSVDVAGNEEGIQTFEFKVDMSAPVTECTIDGSTVTLTATDSGSGVASTWYRIDGGEWIEYEGAFVVQGKGNHTLEYYSVDAAGNNETMDSVQVDGKAGILGLDLWVWAVIIAAVVAVVVLVLFMLMRRRPPRPMELVPGQGVAQQGAEYGPPPPPPQQ